MTAALKDLWPADIQTEDVLSPRDILEFQVENLRKRTNSTLDAEITETQARDRTVLGFEVFAPLTGERIRLFEVHCHPDRAYPVRIIPPEDDLPEYLRPMNQVVKGLQKSGLPPLLAAAREITGQKDPWVVSSPTEFSDRIGEILSRPDVKADVISLLSRSAKAAENGSSAETEE